MPEQQIDINKVLGILEDSKQVLERSHYLEILRNVLMNDDHLSETKVERILTICLHNLQKDYKQVTISLKIITIILTKFPVEKNMPKLINTAKAVFQYLRNVHITKPSALILRADSWQTICLSTFLAFPDSVIMTVACDCDNIMDVFNLYCKENIPINVKILVFSLLHKLLKLMPPEKKVTFVKKGLPAWFSKLIPCVMDSFLPSATASQLLTVIEALELLTEELVKIDYTNDTHWQTVLESIYSPNLYPKAMKNLLTDNNPYWHRLWIIFIKLLKTQITMNKPGVGSPINSMLPVVEMAFKLDVNNRCRAFHCWNVLIDNFSAETNELFINKRIKLLIIPLRASNAKVEETALAKLDTWWHLIKQYEMRMDDRILYPFLHFCFGRHVPEKAFIPGLISPNVKRNCVKAFAELVGHVNCEGCGVEARLKGRLISTKVLVNYWSDWIHSLKMALRISAEEDVGLEKQPILCAWKSIVMTVAELPENNIRKDLFNELLGIIKQMAENCQHEKLVDIVIKVAIASLFDEDMIKPLLVSKEWENGPLHQILCILTGPNLFKACKNFDSEQFLKLMKLIVRFIVNECPHLMGKTLEWLINDSTRNDSTLHLWTALADALQEQTEVGGGGWRLMVCEFMTWPLKHLDNFLNIDVAAATWSMSYIRLNQILCKTAIDVDSIRILTEYMDSNPKVTCFMVWVLATVIKCKVTKAVKLSKIPDLSNELEMLLDALHKVSDFKPLKLVFTTFIGTLNLLMSTDNLKPVILIVKKVLSILNNELRTNCYTHDVEKQILDLVNAILPLHQAMISKGIKFIELLEDELLEFQSLSSSEHPALKTILKSIMSNKLTNQTTIEKNKTDNKTPEVSCEDDVDIVQNKNDKPEKAEEAEFTTPVPKSAKKTTKKKETSIVNTVVENGEEFAVIKSNWKFNPKKLTENQKEKLQRKREDIPALYQDLSQSQDEFRLKPWKTDSQDASTTNSKSASTLSNPISNEDVSTILKDIPGTKIVPKIMENFFSESPKPDVLNKTESQESVNPKSNKKQKSKASPSVKSPRMALKDRVFRNVRNLIEKSTIPKEGTQKLDPLNQTVNSNTCTTPVVKRKETKNIIHSAPSVISADRPPRVKRKPKKFDDTEMYLLKRRRNSDIQNESQASYNIVDNSEEIKTHSDNNDVIPSSANVKTAEDSNKPEIVEEDKVNAPIAVSELIPGPDPDVDNVKLMENQAAEVIISPETESENKQTSEEKPKSNEDVLKCSGADTSTDTSMEDQVQTEKSDKISNNDKSTPKATKGKDSDEVKSSSKKKSRIEKELAIDMVEGHPFLKLQSDKRVTRKCLSNTPSSSRRKNLAEKLNKSKTDPSTSKTKKESLSKDTCDKTSKDVSITVFGTQDVAAADLSEDIIESSQDSMSTISVKSFTNSTKKSLSAEKNAVTVEDTCDIMDNCTQDINTTADVLMTQENRDDTDIPANKTDVPENVSNNLTEEMDTEPISENCISSGEVIIIKDDDDPIIVLNTEDTLPGPDTLEIANADTLPTDPFQFVNNSNVQNESSGNEVMKQNSKEQNESEHESSQMTTDVDDRTITLTDITLSNENDNASSPFKGDDQRKKDFLNNTQEISPIKTLSPIEPSAHSPETSGDFMIVKLSGPVQMNGEPLESHSPEIFTEEKTSPDKRNQSPPRSEVTVHNNGSPSSSLSLKKNRPQVRSGGRAAHMLGLCVPDRLQTIMNIEKPDTEESKKSGPLSTPARRNLRMLYNTAVESENSDENEDSENFLKFKKVLPTSTCSPAGPILKRKLAEITDEATVSPANKRKRVSFHDPVSTSVSVQKYIESSGVRSPQNSALKRLERQLRNHTPMKSPKRLENLFKLDSILTKAVESFTDNDVTNDTQLTSLEQTPAVEIVKTSELNDKDPIYPDLIDCKDSIHNIAAELSSPAMKLLLVKELEGKIETVGDLAKLTELEVNRLCIKAPKIQVVRKVLDDYSTKRSKIVTKENAVDSIVNVEPVVVTCNVEVQTSCSTSETETQTSVVLQRLTSTQTDKVDTAQKSTQSIESGSKPTEDIIKSCIEERKDFVQKLSQQLEEASKRKLAEDLAVEDHVDLLMQKITGVEFKDVLNRVLQRESELNTNGQSGNKQLSFLRHYLCDKFNSKDLILFCSQILQKVHEKSV